MNEYQNDNFKNILRQGIIKQSGLNDINDNQIVQDNIDKNNVDYYITNITPILERHSYNLNSRMFMDNLITTLDVINKTEKFNRSLFNYIIVIIV